MLNDIFACLWFFLPAGLANMFPIFAAHSPVLKKFEQPLDLNLSLGGKRLLGENKTIRGLIVGVCIGMITAAIQKGLYEDLVWLQKVLPQNYDNINPWFLGFLLGLGAITGDAVKSFFKRRLNVPSGESWFFFDQVDYILGGILFSYFYFPLEIVHYFYLIVIYFALHLISTFVGYFLGLKRKPI